MPVKLIDNANIFLFLLLLTACVPSNETKAYVDNYPVWDLSPITQQERFNRIQQHIVPYTFSISHGDTQRCETALEKLKTVTLQNILTPDFVSQSVDDTKLTNQLNICSEKLEPFRDYYPSKEAWKNDVEYSYYFEAAHNMENYDLSKYLGDNYRGFFSEGGRPYCKKNDNKDCLNMIGYHITGKILDTKNCQSNSLNIIGSRLRSISQKIKDDHKVSHYKTNNFFGFITLDNELYQISYRTDQLSDEDCWRSTKSCPMTAKGTGLFLTKVPKIGEQSSLTCVFKPSKP